MKIWIQALMDARKVGVWGRGISFVSGFSQKPEYFLDIFLDTEKYTIHQQWSHLISGEYNMFSYIQQFQRQNTKVWCDVFSPQTSRFSHDWQDGQDWLTGQSYHLLTFTMRIAESHVAHFCNIHWNTPAGDGLFYNYWQGYWCVVTLPIVLGLMNGHHCGQSIH